METIIMRLCIIAICFGAGVILTMRRLREIKKHKKEITPDTFVGKNPWR